MSKIATGRTRYCYLCNRRLSKTAQQIVDVCRVCFARHTFGGSPCSQCNGAVHLLPGGLNFGENKLDSLVIGE